MSSLALYFISKGVQVSGYDRTESSITKELVQKGADVFYDDQINFILDKENIDVVAYTPAIPKSNNQLSYFLAHHDLVIKRAELLGLMTKNNFCIAVAGTHENNHLFNCCSYVGIFWVGLYRFFGWDVFKLQFQFNFKPIVKQCCSRSG